MSVYALAQAENPNLGWAATVTNDGIALSQGQGLYGDPSAGYSGMLYTPLFPFVLSVLLRMSFWEGWAPLLSMLSAIGLAALAGVAGFLRPGSGSGPSAWAGAVVGAIGLGGFALWIVGGLRLDLLYDGRADHFAWILGFAGLFLVVRTADIRVAPLLGGLVLLSLAFWAKQTTLPLACVGTTVVVGIALLARKRRTVALLAVLGVVVGNILAFRLLAASTDGWSTVIMFDLASIHARLASNTYSTGLSEIGKGVGLALILAATLWSSPLFHLAAGKSLRARSILLGPNWRMRLALALWLFVLVGALFALHAYGKQGAGDNQFIGIAYAVAFLVAVGWRSLSHRPRPTRSLLPVLLILSATILAYSPPARVSAASKGFISDPNFVLPAFAPMREWPELPPDWVQLARERSVYHEVFSGLSAKHNELVYQNSINVADLLAGGVEPGHLRDALLDRRFDVTTRFREDTKDPGMSFGYTTAEGRWQQNYFWKLNKVINAGYVTSASVPHPFLVRRQGTNEANRYRDCWGPFEVVGTTWVISGGGGFWCLRGSRVVLGETPANTSSLRTEAPVDPTTQGLGLRLGSASGRLRLEARSTSCGTRTAQGTLRAVGGGPGFSWTVYGASPASTSDGVRVSWQVNRGESVAPRQVVRLPMAAGCAYSLVVTADKNSEAWLGVGA